MNKRSHKQKYLVYQNGTPEMGTEGWSDYYYYAICVGDSVDEIVQDYKEQVRQLYDVDLNPEIDSNGNWADYFNIEYNELPKSVYKNAERLNIKW